LTPKSILGALDEAAGDFDIPAFDNLNVDYIASRLMAYRSKRHWAVVFNSVVWMDGRMQTMLNAVGNCIKDLNAESDSEEWVDPRFVECGLVQVQYDETDDDRSWVTGTFVRGREIPLKSLEIVEDPAIHPRPGFWAATALVGKYRDELLAQPDEIAHLFHGAMPSLLLELDDWCHVDVCGDELPSDSEVFRSLAAAIASNDASLYKPATRGNTHWSHWLPK
jgi:hypothetical protein